MAAQSIFRSGLRWAAAGVGLAVGTYVTYVGVTWSRYGHPPRPNPDEHDESLDRFTPVCEIAERHHVHVTAPAAVTLAVARDIDLYKLLGSRGVQGPRTDSRRHSSRQLDAGPQIAHGHAVPRMGGLGGIAGKGDRCWRRYQAVGSQCHISLTAVRGVRGIHRAGLRQDRLDTPLG